MTKQTSDVILIGGGIMSATLGTLLHELDPSLSITLYETLDGVAHESSDAWNNAGTGHSALCELNYTPKQPDGRVTIDKALHITEMFEISRQFWSYLTEQGIITDPSTFIRSVPHMSFVWGDDNVAYLRARYEAMSKHHFYSQMEFSTDHNKIREWIPLVMTGRDSNQKVAANRINIGTDVNFGALTRILSGYLQKQPGVHIHFNHNVEHLHKTDDGLWELKIKDKCRASLCL
jgi:malate dehydrogenase (quinone)